MLTIVPTPIGNIDDISKRCLDALIKADTVIVEEFREGSTLLKRLNLKKPMENLNEHSKKEDIEALLSLCAQKNVALISDAGTPNFCDPGAELIRLCRKQNIKVNALPGPSSLMLLLSLTSERLDRFYFLGFLPANKEERKQALEKLSKISDPIILMDTPYRLSRLLDDLKDTIGKRKALLAMDLTLPSEVVAEDTLINLAKAHGNKKCEFMLLIYKS
jgi:16S rRNA (cytidine1402-2'-O)-methyltransferase